MALRPFPTMLIALAVVGSAKLAISVMDTTPKLPADGGLFVTSANAAAPSTPEPKEPTPVGTPAKAEAACEMPEEMLQVITTERAYLEEQKAALARRQAEIDLASEQLQLEQGRLDELKLAVEGLLARVENSQTDDVRRLVALYSNMKPKEAAAIMNDLDIEVSVMVLATMNERTAAPILAGLNPVRARAISKIILERSKLPGDQRLNNLKL